MGRLLEVREFDRIICNAEYSGDTKYKYLEEKEFRNLVRFIRSIPGNTTDADILDFMRIDYKRNVGDVVSVKNYVGVIQLPDGFQIQVLPKISLGEEEENYARTKKVFLRMLSSLKKFPEKVFQEASLKADRMNLYELFVNMYLQEVRRLVKKGIKSDYVEQEENLSFYKGKLLVNKHLQMNLVHKERFFAAYQEFHPNRAENRIIKATLLKLQKLTNSVDNAKEILKLLTAFEMVDKSVNYTKDFAGIVSNRNTRDYEMLMQWSKVFLLNKNFTTFSGDTAAQSLLFPMELVYESYVAQQMKKVMSLAGWQVSSQEKKKYLFDNSRSFALKPDIVMKRNGRIVILDTKWKELDGKENGSNYGISQADMYQMYAYSKKYGTSEIWLLYPINDAIRKEGDREPVKFVSEDKNSKTEVNVYFVDLDKIEESLEILKARLEE